MDAGKIRNALPAVDLRADSGFDTQSGRRSDAGALAAKAAPLLALDSLLTSPDGDLHAPDTPAFMRPPAGVVVNLSLPALGAETARQFARALAPVTDYSHLDPHKSQPARAALQGDREPDPVTTAAVAAAVTLGNRENPEAAQLATSPGARPDLYPHGIQHAAPPRPGASESPKVSGSDPVSQARNAERLAGLALAAERFAGTPARLGKLALGAAILGALVVVLLI